MEPTKQADLAESKAGQAESEVDTAEAKAAKAEPKARRSRSAAFLTRPGLLEGPCLRRSRQSGRAASPRCLRARRILAVFFWI